MNCNSLNDLEYPSEIISKENYYMILNLFRRFVQKIQKYVKDLLVCEKMYVADFRGKIVRGRFSCNIKRL